MINEQTETGDPEIDKVLRMAREELNGASDEDTAYLQTLLAQEWEAGETMVAEKAKSMGYAFGPVYHSTSEARIKGGKIDLERLGENFDGWTQLGRAFYTHTNPKSAGLYGNYTFPFFVKLDSPYRGQMGEFEDYGGDNRAKVEAIQKKGHDAIIIDEVEGDQVAIYNPENVKYGGVISYNFRDELVLLSERFDKNSGSVYR